MISPKIEMHPDWRRRWIAALRSGEYAQTRGTLRQIDIHGKNPRYCCLGVLCEISGQGSWVGLSLYRVKGGLSNSKTKLPALVAQLVGLERGQALFIDLNDQQGLTFREIADILDDYGSRP